MDRDVELLYRQHLTERDLKIIERATGGGELAKVLGHPDLETAVFANVAAEGPFEELPSPFLTFAVAVHRTAERLERATFVQERFAPRQRIPVFDVATLKDLLAAPMRRYFLVELLASYTHVTSGVAWTRTRRGWRRRRFNELDPVRLAGLLEVVGEAERAGIYRRLGDLALFLTGIFYDHTAVHGIEGIAAARLVRLSGLPPALANGLSGVELLEQLGRRWYRAAAAVVAASGLPLSPSVGAAKEIGERFGDARRVLNAVADDYLFPLRGRLFGMG
jgi:hypothetical protein